MPVEIICTIVSVCGTVLSALIAWFVSRSIASKEIERLKLSWEREDVVTSDDDFADLAAQVALFSSSYLDGYEPDTRQVRSKIAAVMSRESGSLAESLDSLYSAVQTKNPKLIDSELAHVIEEKRKRKCTQHRSGG